MHFSNILAMVPCPGTLADQIHYEAHHTGSKLQLNNTSIDSIELTFVDKWGDLLVGLKDFVIELTADFVKLGSLYPNQTAMDVRQMQFYNM